MEKHGGTEYSGIQNTACRVTEEAQVLNGWAGSDSEQQRMLSGLKHRPYLTIHDGLKARLCTVTSKN